MRLKKERNNIDNQDKINSKRAKEKERKSSQLKTVTAEHIAQTIIRWAKVLDLSHKHKEKN